MRTLLAVLATCVLSIVAPGMVPGARAEQVKLTWFMWSGSDAEVTAWKHVASMVSDKYPDIAVDFQTTAFLDYWTKLPALAASGRLPDIVSLQSQRFPGFAQLMEPLDPLIARDKFDTAAFEPSIFKSFDRGGHQLALPYDFGPLFLYYNHDMFQKAGLPLPAPGWTGADYDKAAKALTTGDTFGGVVSVPDAFMAFAKSEGATWLDSKGQLDLVNPGLKKAFADYVGLVATSKVAPLFPASGTLSSAVANGRFTAGAVAMYVDGPWQLINVKRKAGFTVGVAPVPARAAGNATISAGSGFGIASTSRHKEEAWKAIQVMTGPEAEQYLAENGRAFSARSAMQKYWLDTAAAGVVGTQEAIAASLKVAEPYRTTPNWASVAALFEQYAPLAFAGSQPPDKVLETIQQLATQQ